MFSLRSIKFCANFCLALICVLSLSAYADQTPVRSAGVVTFTLGKAYINEDNKVVVGTQINQGDVIETLSNGHVHIRFVDDGLVSVRPDSKLSIEQYQYNAQHPDDSIIKFDLEEGVMRSISGQGAKAARDKFRLNTPIAAIGVRGTDFVVKASSNLIQAVVNEGAIVVAPFSNQCDASALGPCANSVELSSAAQQLLELSSLYDTPRLVPLSAAFSSDLVNEQSASLRKSNANESDTQPSEEDLDQDSDQDSLNSENVSESQQDMTDDVTEAAAHENDETTSSELNTDSSDDNVATDPHAEATDFEPETDTAPTEEIDSTTNTSPDSDMTLTEGSDTILASEDIQAVSDPVNSATEDELVKDPVTHSIDAENVDSNTTSANDTPNSTQQPDSEPSYFSDASTSTSSEHTTKTLESLIAEGVSDAEIKNIIAERVADANLTASNTLDTPADGRKLAWGRFSVAGSEIQRDDSVVYGDIMQAARGRLLEPASFISSRDYKHVAALFRSNSELERLDTTLGKVTFDLAASQASLYAKDGRLMPLDVSESFLQVDFTQGRFDTGITVGSEHVSDTSLYAKGRVNPETGEFETTRSNGHLKGATTFEGDEASYIIYKDVDAGVIEGATYWRNK